MTAQPEQREKLRGALWLQAALLLASSLSFSSCHASSAVGAIAVTSAAGGVSAYRRSMGECYVDCLPGTFCNHATGMCDPLACRGKCDPGYVCEETGTGSACVPQSQSRAAQSQIEGRPFEGPRPFGESQAAQPSGAIGATGALPGGSSGPSDGGSGSGGVSAGVDGGAPPSITTHAGAPSVPAAAIQGGRTREKDAPATPAEPWINPENPWDPHHADPAPQMSNPNLPPPH